MNWDDLRTALAVRRGGTLSAAARALGINQTTAARRLDRLERQLGARLFDRIDGRMVPTEVGRSALDQATIMEDAAQGVLAGAQDADTAPAGAVRLTSLPSFVTGYLAPRLADFAADHPAIAVELVGASENLHLGRREADLAVRYSRPTAGNLRARRIGAVGYAGYASRSLDLGRPLPSLPWVAYDEAFGELPEQRWLDDSVRPTRIVATASDVPTLLALSRHGAGAAMLPCFMADAVPELRRITGPDPVCRREIWLLSHPDLRQVRRIAAVADWLIASVERDRALLEG